MFVSRRKHKRLVELFRNQIAQRKFYRDQYMEWMSKAGELAQEAAELQRQLNHCQAELQQVQSLLSHHIPRSGMNTPEQK